ncbi:MAG: hypothetical protein Q4B26_18955 [Eubacteriales bacterium]|nr:hypothetical protein [Eubacteriales bacterium]
MISIGIVMMIIGIIGVIAGLVLLIILPGIFKKQRKKMLNKVEYEYTRPENRRR